VAKLLVSVRSASEARAALVGGAAIVDVKEPAHGPLGRAPSAVWRAVRDAVPMSIPVSVALGELEEWHDGAATEIPCEAWSGISFCKLGLSHAQADWRDRWHQLRMRLGAAAGRGLAWVAVVYTDWETAGAPEPDAVIGSAAEINECRGVLFDTWDKSRGTTIDETCKRRIARVRASGRLVALAGSLDAGAIARLAGLEPDIFAVRGAACRGGNREADIDPNAVARLVRGASAAMAAPSEVGGSQLVPTSNRTPWARGRSLP
jgi:uncharacterized protein (UPF0264 family)